MKAFVADPACLKDEAIPFEIAENDEGYILRKAGSDIVVHYSDEVEVALYKGILNEEGRFSSMSLYNYYTSFNESVAVIDSLKDTSAVYEIQVLNDVGSATAYEKVNLPKNAAAVKIASENRSAIYYNNDLPPP